jgi:hypothetical protein
MGSRISSDDKLSDDDIHIYGSCDIDFTINCQNITSSAETVKARKDGKIRVDMLGHCVYLSFDKPQILCGYCFGYDVQGGTIYLFITKLYDEICIINNSNSKLTVYQNGDQSYILEKSFSKYLNHKSIKCKPHIFTHKVNEISFDKHIYRTGAYYCSKPRYIDGLLIQYDSSIDKFVISNID